MRQFAFVFLTFSFLVSATPSAVCVRNYLKGQNDYDPCENLPGYSYAIPKSGSGKVCTRADADYYCHLSTKGYVEITSPTGQKFCTVDFNQPGVTNYCQSASQYYDYVDSGSED